MFLFLWPVTASTLMMVLSWCLGLGITIGLKSVVMMLGRKKYHQAFMRKRPRAANYNSLAMECWHLGVGGGTLLSRLGQFLFAAAFWIGRIDVPFLAESVNLFGYSFDYVPINYRKEILVHETHKHPFINRLGGMFLMRIKHGSNFSSAAGTQWRLLFTIALFPWLAKYRKRKDKKDEEEKSMMLSSFVSTPREGRIQRLKNRIEARERLTAFRGRGKQAISEAASEGGPKRTGAEVLVG